MSEEDAESFLGIETQAQSKGSALAVPPLPIGSPLLSPPTDMPVAAMPTFPVDGTRPLVRILDQQVTVHASPDSGTETVGVLSAGDVVELQKVWKVNGEWVEIRAANNARGYMPGSAKVAFLQRVKQKDKQVVMTLHASAPGEPTGYQLAKGTTYWLETDKSDPTTVLVRLDSGQCGTIPAAAKVAVLPQVAVVAVQSAGHDILVGLAWCIGGLVITGATYSAVAESGGTYLICWGPVLFGGFQVLKGLVNSLGATKPTCYPAQTPGFARGSSQQ